MHSPEGSTTFPASLLGFEDFWKEIERGLRLRHRAMVKTARLQEDLELDSLQMFELLLTMEELGADVPEEYVSFLVTIGDLHDHYVTRVTAERGGDGRGRAEPTRRRPG